MTALITFGLGLIGLLFLGGFLMSRMPGQTLTGQLPPLDESLNERSDRLAGHVHHLADVIGERHLWRPESLEATAQYLEAELRAMGYEPRQVGYDIEGQSVRNIEVTVTGRSRRDEMLVVGAHYDTVPGTPGANDNGSAVAALLELARAWQNRQPERSLRFVAFVNEEPPFFKTNHMGSRVYARQLEAEHANVAGMFSLETIGYYRDEPSSQRFPLPLLRFFYPTRGNFLAFVGDFRSRSLLRQSLLAFRRTERFPSEGIVAPANLTGIDWSDHWSFWQSGWPAVMITDTAVFRYPHYHGRGDTPDQLDYAAMARIVTGLETMLDSLANTEN